MVKAAWTTGAVVGLNDGCAVIAAVGEVEGFDSVGWFVGTDVGCPDGMATLESVGLNVGSEVGDPVGAVTLKVGSELN